MNLQSEHHVIIGTAGHVDHGKTVLIKALTGIETDRFKEEQERGISIDIGFAPFRLADGTVVGVVDVPGHERFIHNMLAGIGGIDLVLLVVDVNEGVMPQTREHLQILQLLQIPRGILVLTKCDTADPEFVDLVEEDVREEVAGTFLQEAPCCRVSALEGTGMEQLVATISAEIKQLPPKDCDGPMRLPIDRHFTVAGFGTVVTGTLLSGQVKIGDQVEVLPADVQVRVRDIQVHGKKVDQAFAGQRVALNLAGLDRQMVPRGSVVGTPGVFTPTTRCDTRVTLLEDAPRPLRFRDPVHICLGTARAVGLVALLDRDVLKPGESALVQIHLDRPLVAHRQDRFIIRSYSPLATIGGGSVVDANPIKHKRFRDEVMTALKELESGERSFLLGKLQELGCGTLKELEIASGLGRDRIQDHLQALAASSQVEQLGNQWTTTDTHVLWQQRLEESVADFHRRQPLQSGIARATLKGALPQQLSQKGFDLLLEQLLSENRLLLHGEAIASPDFERSINPADQERMDKISTIYRNAGPQAKNKREMLEQAALSPTGCDHLFQLLFEQKTLIKLNEESFLHAETYQHALKLLQQHFASHKTLTLAEFRDQFGSARKQVQALLEYWDSLKYTLRKENERVAWKLPEVPPEP
ncbi:MAG: selenocysteine-specific translation elongation factor [Desulfuromonas sp.]|nr:MAG: selenocysteine-specific translation elongation factor [Desulfuromonas sp.]